MLGALVADRAKQQPGEATVAARSDHQQVVFGDGVDQDLRGTPLHDRPFNLDVVGVAERGERLVEDRLRRLLGSGRRVGSIELGGLGRVGVADERGHERVDVDPRVDRP
jgi:hypothetical protein